MLKSLFRYIGEVHPEKTRPIKGPCIQTHTIPNPIITVTEHTPTPSPEYMRRQVKYISFYMAENIFPLGRVTEMNFFGRVQLIVSLMQLVFKGKSVLRENQVSLVPKPIRTLLMLLKKCPRQLVLCVT